PPVTGPATSRWAPSGCSGRPAWTIRRRWRRYVPSPPISRGSWTPDRRPHRTPAIRTTTYEDVTRERLLRGPRRQPRGHARGDQAGLPQARPHPAPGRQPGRGGRGEVQEGLAGL